MADPSHQAARPTRRCGPSMPDRRVEPCPGLYYGSYPVRPSWDFGNPLENARRGRIDRRGRQLFTSIGNKYTKKEICRHYGGNSEKMHNWKKKTKQNENEHSWQLQKGNAELQRIATFFREGAHVWTSTFIYTQTHTQRNTFRQRSPHGISSVGRSPTLPFFFFLSDLLAHCLFGYRRPGTTEKKNEVWRMVRSVQMQFVSFVFACFLAPPTSKAGEKKLQG